MSQNKLQTFDAALVAQIMQLLGSAQRIALLAHEGPDGDCIGSALGLAHILQALGKTCVPACADPAPKSLSFLPGLELLAQDLGTEAFDLVIALDAGELYRYGQLYAQHRAFLDQAHILNIDHHLGNGGCGQVNLVDVQAAATAEIVVLLQEQAELPLPREAAICLLTGLITDTNSFQFSNTTPRTLEVAASLLRAGAVPEQIVQPIYRERSLALARFQALIIEQAGTSCDGRLIWSWANQETLVRAGATRNLDDNTSGLLRDIAGTQIAVIFKSYDDPQTTRMSMRTAAGYNAAELCKRLSNGTGGGHARAAGATLALPLQEAIKFVIAELENVLSNG